MNKRNLLQGLSIIGEALAFAAAIYVLLVVFVSIGVLVGPPS